MKIRPYRDGDENSVISLWESCNITRPWNDPRKDIRRKLSNSPETFLVGELDEEIVATVMVGYDGHRGWINYLAVAPEHQRTGFGSRMMDEAERILRDSGCPKINLQIRQGNDVVVKFYKSMGYTVDRVISMGKRLDPD